MSERICKKCQIIREMSGSLEDYLDRYLSQLTEDEQAEDAVYEQRIATCGDCEMLLENMCRGCGCYVAFRAAVQNQKCPYHKW